METAYEKVCPACGRSATLAAKFCSGCGHQYRTVFHDQAGSADGQDDGAEESATNFDARWAPIVALTPVVIVMFIVSSRPAPVTVPVQQQTASVVSYSQPVGTVNAGMSPGDVQQALGRPDTVKPMSIGGVNTQEWYYTRAGGHTFEVHFNGAGVVDTWANY